MSAPSSSSSASADASSSADPSLVAGACMQGAKTWQEDAFLAYSSPSKRVVCAAVFDGHGGFNGMLASAHCRDLTRAMLVANEAVFETWSPDEWSARVAQHFADIHNAVRELLINPGAANGGAGAQPRFADAKGVVRLANGDPVHGGTTGSIVVYAENKSGQRFLVSANVGDSDVILVPSNPAEWKPFSVDHGPDSTVEWQRINALDKAEYPSKLIFVYDKNNVYKKYSCPRVFLDSGVKDPQYVANPWGLGLHPTNVRYDPAVYAVTGPEVQRDTTCIAMTRSIGDFYAHPFGLSYEPSVQVVHLPSGSADEAEAASESTPLLVVVASDGVWDCWRYEIFAEHILGLWRAPEASLPALVASSVDLTIKKAIENFGARHYDDASFVLLQIPPPSRSSPPADASSSSSSSFESSAASSSSDSAAAGGSAEAAEAPKPFGLRRALTIQGAPANAD